MNLTYNIKNNARIFFIGTMFFWVALTITFNYFPYSLSSIVALFSLAAYPFLNIEKQFLFLLTALPFVSIYKIYPGLPSLMFILYFITSVKVVKKVGISRTQLSLLSLFFLLQLIVNLINFNGLLHLVSFELNIIFIIVLTNYFHTFDTKTKKSFLTTVTLFYTISVVIMSILSMVFNNISSIVSSREVYFYVNETIINRFCGIVADPNYYTQMILVSFTLCVDVLIFERIKISKKMKYSLFFSSALILYFGTLTYSKSYFIVISIIALISIIYYLKSNNSKKKIRFILPIAIILLFLMCQFFVTYIIPAIMQRVTTTVDLTSGRLDIWNSYFELACNDSWILLIGAGIENARNLVTPYLGRPEAAHNVYIELLFDCGIIGCIFLYLMNKRLMDSALKNLMKSSRLFFIVFCITSAGISLSAYDLFCFVFIILEIVNFKAKDIDIVR
mgnify:CR=1 FL=1